MIYEQITKHTTVEQSVPFAGQKLGMNELRAALGFLTTPYEVDDKDQESYMRRCTEDQQIALDALAAYKVGNAHTLPVQPEEAERYGHAVMAYTEAVLAAIDTDDGIARDLGAGNVIEVNFKRQTHFDETA